MNLKKVFLGAVAVGALSLTYASCSSDDIVNNGATQADKVGMYMSLQVVGSKTAASTRTTAGGQGTEVGTDAQNKISSLLVLLCNKSTHAVVESHLISSDDLIATTNGVSTKVVLTKEGAFEVYAIANPTASMTYAAGTVLTGQTIENVSEALMQSDYAASNKFIMFNECNGTDKVAGVDLTITKDNTYDNPARCEAIHLDRLAVQIRSKADAVNVDEIQAANSFLTAASLQGFKLLNGATKVNLQQKWSNAVADMGDSYPWFNLLQTPTLSEGTNAGSDADYYNHLTDFRTVSKTGSDFTVVKDLYANVAAYEPTAKGSIFCMENHPSTATALLGNTTGLVYQFKTTVTGSDNKAGTGSFYGYNGKYFATLAALQAAYPHAFDNATGDDKLAAAETELSDAYASADKETAISKFRVKYNVKVYTDGIMYYTYFIKDRNYVNAATSGKNYYSVMRNTIYDLTVTDLLKIGTDIPGGWDPDNDEPTDPVEPTNVYMVVEASVNNWVLSKEDNIQLQ